MSKINHIYYKLYSVFREEDPWGEVYTIRHPNELSKYGFSEDEIFSLLYCGDNVRGWVCQEEDIELKGVIDGFKSNRLI